MRHKVQVQHSRTIIITTTIPLLNSPLPLTEADHREAVQVEEEAQVAVEEAVREETVAAVADVNSNYSVKKQALIS
jgi:hypothetical protein